MRRRVRSIITGADSGILITDFLVRRFRFKDDFQWGDSLDKGKVLLNDGVAGRNSILKCGDEVCYEAPEAPEPEVDRNISVLYEDEYLIAVNKTGNLPCHPSGAYLENTLLHFLKKKLKVDSLHFVNRLDRETSGVVIVAKDVISARNLSDQFMTRQVRKFYSVVVEGVFPDKLDVKGWLLQDEKSVVRKKRCFQSGDSCRPFCLKSEWSETLFELKEQYKGIALVNAELMTGRMHQIRATLCSLGYPVVGDKIYGVDESIFLRFINDQLTDEDRSKLRLGRQALHARELQFSHPVNEIDLTISAPLPNDISLLLESEICA